MTVTASLSSAYLNSIRATALGLIKAEQEKTRREWILGETANDEWQENRIKYQAAGIGLEEFDILTSQAINKVAGFALITETGATMRMYREVTAQFENVPAELKQLPFQYFRNARALWNKAEHGETIKPIPAPIVPIAEAYANGWTAKEMLDLYTDPAKAVQEMASRINKSHWTAEKVTAFNVALEQFIEEWKR